MCYANRSGFTINTLLKLQYSNGKGQTQTGPSLAGQPPFRILGSGLANALTDVCSGVLLVALQSGCRSLSHDQLSRDHWILSLRCEVD